MMHSWTIFRRHLHRLPSWRGGRGGGLLALAVAAGVVWMGSCSGPDRSVDALPPAAAPVAAVQSGEAERQQGEAAQERRLYAELVSPLTEGQRQLAVALAAAGETPTFFRLDASGATPLNRELVRNEDLWDEGMAVFFRLGVDPLAPAGAIQHLYFNPRELRLTPVMAAPASCTDLAAAGLDRFSLYRAVPPPGGGGLEIYRFDFSLGADGHLVAEGRLQLTTGGNCSLPVPLPDGATVVYLQTRADGRRHLLAVSRDGGEPRAVIPRQDFEVALPRLLPDGGLLVAADPEGFFRLYRLDLATGKRTVWNQPPPAPVAGGEVVLGCRFTEGAVIPAVFRLPAAYDLRTVLALVAAHNPAINRRRALLAAALIEARQLGMVRPPDPAWGAAYAPADGRFGQGLMTGDGLAESLANGQFGLVQSLLDGGRMSPLDEAGALRAGIAHDVLLDETNLRLAEAAELYYQARAGEAALQIHLQLRDNARQRETYVDTLHARGEALAVDQLEVRQAVAQAEADLALDRQRLDYQRARLRELCNLPAGTELPFTADSFQAEQVEAPDFQALRQLALLNHPRLRAARRALVAAFADAAAPARARPESFLSLAQGRARALAADPLDDYVARSLSGRLPPADRLDHPQAAQRWQAVREAMRLDEEEQTQAVTGTLDAALVEFQRSRESLRVRQADLAAALERVRLARLRASLGPVDETRPVSPLDLIQAHHAFYRGLLAMQEARTDAAVLHARMWREVGLAGQLTERCVEGDSTRLARAASAVWVRSSRALIADDGAIARFLDQARQQRLRRVYLDLEPDARLLAEQESAERLALFIHRCAAGGLEVWGLMGGAGWLDEGAAAQLPAGVRRIAEFHQRFAPLEPRLAGLKLDVAPPAQPGWAGDPRQRDELNRRYLALLRAARDSLPAELPLWLDCPVDFFRPEHAPLLGELAPLVDGLTVQCASDRPAWIQARADEALATWPKALEVGLELSPTAPAGETLARWRDDELQALRRHLVERFADHPRFAGLALHDAAGLEPPPKP